MLEQVFPLVLIAIVVLLLAPGFIRSHRNAKADRELMEREGAISERLKHK
jgi:type II secretory pathway pseudopilin PulG